MSIRNVSSKYFAAPETLKNYKNNKPKENRLAILSVLSYITVVTPITFGVMLGVSELCKALKKRTSSPTDNKVKTTAKPILSPKATDSVKDYDIKLLEPIARRIVKSWELRIGLIPNTDYKDLVEYRRVLEETCDELHFPTHEMCLINTPESDQILLARAPDIVTHAREAVEKYLNQPVRISELLETIDENWHRLPLPVR